MLLPQLASAYSTSLVASPIATKALTACVIGLLGDALAQRTDRNVRSYDALRGVSFGAFGAIYGGAVQHHLFEWLQVTCVGALLGYGRCLSLPETQWLAAVEATLLNQLLFIPMLYYPIFFALKGTLNGAGLRSIVIDARGRYLGMLQTNWAFWIPMNILVFRLVDAELLVSVNALIGVVWNFILSALTTARRAVPMPAVA